jgi:ankyrin repeat protein
MKIFKIFFSTFFFAFSMSLQGALSPLAEAVKMGDIIAVKLIIQNGVDINQKDPLYWMPLHFAAMLGHHDIIMLLLEHGADINKTSCWGWTPLHAATASNQIEAAKILIQHGADIYKKSPEDRTPLDCLSPELRIKFLRFGNNQSWD